MLLDERIEQAAVEVSGKISPRGAGEVVEVEAEGSWFDALTAQLVAARLDAIKSSQLGISNGAGDLSKVGVRRLGRPGIRQLDLTAKLLEGQLREGQVCLGRVVLRLRPSA